MCQAKKVKYLPWGPLLDSGEHNVKLGVKVFSNKVSDYAIVSEPRHRIRSSAQDGGLSINYTEANDEIDA